MELFTYWAAARLKSARTLPKTPSPRNGAIVRAHATFRFVINGWEHGRLAPLCRGDPSGRPMPGAAVRKRATTRVAPNISAFYVRPHSVGVIVRLDRAIQ